MALIEGGGDLIGPSSAHFSHFFLPAASGGRDCRLCSAEAVLGRLWCFFFLIPRWCVLNDPIILRWQ